MQQNVFPSAPVAQETEEAIDYKRIIFLFLKNWYWFVFCTGITIIGAFIFTHYYRQQTYTVDTSILVNEDDQKLDMDNIFEKALMNGASDVTIGNEIELLNSYTLARNVFEKLNWRTSWYQKDFFKWDGLYTREPFFVQESENGGDLEGLVLFIEPIKISLIPFQPMVR